MAKKKTKKTKKVAKKRITKITAEMEKSIIGILEAEWQYIAYDMLQACGGSMSAQDIRDTVPDYVYRQKSKGDGPKEAYEIWHELDYDLKDTLLEKAFPIPYTL